ncbi:hypothetical protein ACHAPT_006448 [Fusarium lateritium]
MWKRPNDYPIPPSQEQLSNLVDFEEKARAEPYYAAAQKRMGLLGNTIQDIQCYFFATIFEKFALRPLRAWNGEGYWMKNPSHLIRQYHECEQQVSLWKYHLPSVVQFEDDVLPDEEFAAALQGRASLWREYTLRPILYYLLHHNPEEPPHPEAEALAAKEVQICANMVHRLAFHRRHGGTWLIARKTFMAACVVLASAVNSHLVSPPEEWHTIVAIAIQTLERWAKEASDLRRMADILVHMYRETCRQREELEVTDPGLQGP